jgi:sugar O-acyltransferase (sialic acid O-acetyltransferase NeuD family)
MARLTDLLIIGAGGQAKVVIDAVLAQGKYNILGLVDMPKDKSATELLGYQIKPTLADYPRCAFFVAVGDNKTRKRLFEEALSQELEAATIVHPSAVVSRFAKIEEGTIICAGAVVGVNAHIGSNVIINTASSVDHDSLVESHVHIAVGAHLAGSTTVGEGALVGVGAVTIPGIVVGAWSIVGAGAALTANIEANATAVGVPARILACKS